MSWDPERAEIFGFNTSSVVGSASALFFVVLLAHIELRRAIEADGIVYLESFYSLSTWPSSS